LPVRFIREFIKLESSGGVFLFVAAVLALVIANSPLYHYYLELFQLPFSVELGVLKLSKPFLLWINDGLMTIFFLLVGLEIKRELLEGELNSLAKASLPALAALGGMVVPACIYLFFNWGDSVALRGWAIPTATDIAFSLGILSLLGSRIPVSLKIYLTALAIFDDIGAIIIIAIFYTKKISLVLLGIAALLIIVLWILNRAKVVRYAPYFLVGTILWVCVLKSGVHATLAGIVLAFAIPIRDRNNQEVSPLRDLEHKLHPWVAFGVLPLFAFANAGVSFKGVSVSELLGPIPLGIAMGLFVGKQIGIWSATMLGIKAGVVQMPKAANGLSIYGISLIAGVGFTMSLFIGGLAFGGMGVSYAAHLRLGVIVGSLLSGLLGYLILRFVFKPMHYKKNMDVSQVSSS